MSTRGFFGIGILNGKAPVNIGTLWRSANIFGASFIFTIGERYRQQASDTLKTPRHIPLHHYPTFAAFMDSRPHAVRLIGIEVTYNSIDLPKFVHPEQAIYLLGAEDNGLTKEAVDACQSIVSIPSSRCLNVAVAGSIVMYDRQTKKGIA